MQKEILHVHRVNARKQLLRNWETLPIHLISMVKCCNISSVLAPNPESPCKSVHDVWGILWSRGVCCGGLQRPQGYYQHQPLPFVWSEIIMVCPSSKNLRAAYMVFPFTFVLSTILWGKLPWKGMTRQSSPNEFCGWGGTDLNPCHLILSPSA